MKEQGTERSCIVTREAQPKDGLLRFVVSPEGMLIPDVAEKLPGRGIWVTASRSILQQALDRQLMSRAAKQKVTIPSDLLERVESLLLKRVQDWLSLTVKSGESVAGFVKVEAWLAKRKVGLILEAVDGAEDGRAKLLRLAPDIPCEMVLTRNEMAEPLGRDDVVHLAIASGGILQFLLRDVRRLAGFRKKDTL